MNKKFEKLLSKCYEEIKQNPSAGKECIKKLDNLRKNIIQKETELNDELLSKCTDFINHVTQLLIKIK